MSNLLRKMVSILSVAGPCHAMIWMSKVQVTGLSYSLLMIVYRSVRLDIFLVLKLYYAAALDNRLKYYEMRLCAVRYDFVPFINHIS